MPLLEAKRSARSVLKELDALDRRGVEAARESARDLQADVVGSMQMDTSRGWRPTRLKEMQATLNRRVAQWVEWFGADLEPHLRQAMALGGDLVDVGAEGLNRPPRVASSESVGHARDRAKAQLLTVLQDRLQQSCALPC